MRKFTLLLMLFCMLIGTAWAQTTYDGIYTMQVDENQQRGYVVAGEGYADYPVLDGITLGGYEDNSTPAIENGKNWYITTTNDGTSYYIYNVAVGKFLVGTGSQINFGDTPYLWKISANGSYLNIEDVANAGKFMSGGCGRTAANRPMAYDTNKNDGGAKYTITAVAEGETTFATAIAAADAAIQAHEDWQAATDSWTTTTAPTLSTDDAPVYYSIKNLRKSKFAAWNSLGSPLKQTTDDTEAGAVWYFVDAKAAAGEVAEGVIPVYIKNAASGLALTNATSMNYAETGTVFYLIPHENTYNGYVICTASAISNVRDCWCDENGSGLRVCYYMGDDSGSIWAFVPTSPSAVTSSKSKEPALFENELASAKTTAIAEAEALGSRDYYAYADADVTECVNAINAVTASTYEEFVTAKTTTIPACVAALKAKTPTKNVFAGGEYIKFHWQRDTRYYLTTNAAEATSEAAANATNLLGNQTATDARNIWQVVANSDNTGFYLYNPLSGKYVKHAAGAQLTLVADPAEASVYTFQAQNDYFWATVGAGDENTDYLILNNVAAAVGGKAVDNDNRANWYIEKPSDDEVATLENLLASVSDLQAQAIAAANTQIDGLNTGREFYLYDTAKMDALKTAVAEKINAATTRAELTAAKLEVATLINDFINATDNRTNPLAAGTKVKFLNKEVNTNYMTTDANGATTSSEVTTASVWELVANDKATGYYLYNNLSGKYLKHAAQNGGQATLVAKTEATLYNVQPKGAYVVMGEVVPTSDRAYVHCDDPSNKITRYTEESDRSLWTVTSATDDEISQLNTEIQTNITTQLDAAVAAADAVVNPYKALEFYKPQAAITTYDAAIAAAKDGVDTYDELAAALEAITAAQAAFEAAVAADDVELSNTVGDGTRIKLRNRLHSEYWMSAIDGKVGMKSATDASSIWTLKAAADGGFYLLNPLTNKYVKHIDENNTKFELVEGTENASVYYVHSSGLYVTVGRLAEQSKDTDSREYLHGVNWDANGQWVVRWNAVGEASHWTLASVTDDEVDALNDAISVEASAQWEAYKAKAQETVDAYAELPYFTATEAAVTAYNNAVNEIGEVVTYLGLSNGKARLDEALNAFLATDRSASNLVQDGDQIRLVNKHAPTFYMTTDANGVDAYADNSETNYVSSTIWTAVGNSTDGYKLYNPLKNRYIVHPTGNGVQAALVEDAAQATLYDIVPNGLYVNITLKEVGEEERPCLHFGTENHVTKFTASDARSLWGIFKATEAEKTQLPADIEAYVKATITAAQEEALQNANATDDFAYYACSAENVAIAVAAINAVSTEIATHEQLSEGLAAINAALETLYASERTAGPAVGDRIRFINRYFTTHYLGYNSTGLAHYEPNTADDATENLPSTTIWELEVSEKEGQFYLKNYLLGLYACFEEFNENSQIVLRQEKKYPVKLIQKETIGGMWYFDIETPSTEVHKSYNSVHATDNGSTVQGDPDNYGSHWMITRATDEDLESVNLTAQLSALIDFVLKPVIEEAKRYYYVDAGGQVVNNFVDDVKAGYYTYTGDGSWDTYKESYVNDINTCISISENVFGTNSDQVHAAADVLRANIAKFSLNLPRTNGFFRLKCVYNNQYLQADANRQKLALNEETGKASIFYYEAKGNGDDAKTFLGTLVSYDQGLYFTQGISGGIYAKLQPIGTAGDTFSFSIPANNTFGSYNISSASGSKKRYLYGNAVERTEWQVIDGDSVEVKYYRADNGDNATVAIQGDSNNNGYNWILEEVEEIPVTINAYGYSTFFTPVALNIPEGVEASICTGIDENSDLVLQKLEGMILPYTAVILKAEALAGQDVYFTPASANDVMPLLEDENYLHGGVYKTWRKPECQNKNPEMTSATGTNANLPYLEEAADDKVYTLAKKNDKVAMYQYAGNKFTHFRAFLKLPAVVNANLAAVLNFAEIEEPTGIEEAPAISLEDAIIYDLSGRRVAEPTKGVYIVNGKKVYFK